jgi:hypothetical protein
MANAQNTSPGGLRASVALLCKPKLSRSTSALWFNPGWLQISTEARPDEAVWTMRRTPIGIDRQFIVALGHWPSS